MKALTLTQPWATLVAIKAKTIETRSWRTPYTGLLAIHAAKGFAIDNVRLVLQREPFKTTLKEAGYPLFSLLPRGSVIAVATLKACYHIQESYLPGFCAAFGTISLSKDTLEAAFGDFTPGRFAWILSDVRALTQPIPAKGALGLWEWAAPTNLEELLI